MLDAVDSAASDIRRAVAHAARGDRGHPARHQPGRRTAGPGRAGQVRRVVGGPRRRGQGRHRGAEHRSGRPAGRLHPADPGRRRSGPAAGRQSPRSARPPSGSAVLRAGAVHRPVPGALGVGLHRHPPRQRRPGGPHPVQRGGPPTRGRRVQEEDQHQRGDRPRQRRVDAGRPGPAAGQRRRAGRPARNTRPAMAAAGQSDMGAMVGGIILGNILTGGIGGGGFGGGGGGWTSTTYGGSRAAAADCSAAAGGSSAQPTSGAPGSPPPRPSRPVPGVIASRSRTVTAWSSRVSKSTVTQNGVPISSWRR